MDSVILAHEVIHSLKTTKIPGMLIKLDLSKSFDRISWQYMRSMLESFGFDKHWVNWILKLTSSAFSPYWSMECPPNPSPLPEESVKETPSLPSSLF
jgi:hypothetical protein